MRNRVKVLQVIGGGEFGGAEQYLVTLLRAFDKQKFDVEVACLFAEPLAGILAGEKIPHRTFPMSGKKDMGVILRLSRYIEEGGFDIVHTHGVRANLVGRLAARKAGVKNIVTTIHSVLEYDYPRKTDLWVNKLSEKMTAKLTRQFIAVSESLARYVRESYGLNKRKVTVIHNGLELERFTPKGAGWGIRKEYAINDSEVVIGVISRLHPVKGHSILFYAFRDLLQDFPFLKLLVVGSGPEKEGLQSLARELGIDRAVIFTGFRKNVPDVLAGIDIVVQPSLSEGFGLTVVEAMAATRPVVASAVGGVKEIIRDRDNGLLVTPGDPLGLTETITSLLELPGRAVEIARAGRRTVEERFSAERMARKTEEVYNRMLSRQLRKNRRGKR